MSDGLSESAVEGRPSPGGALALEMQSAAERRGSTRKLTALSTLWPILKAHGFETFIACLLMVATSSATLGMSGAVRLLVEHLTSNRSGESVDRWFWLLGAVAVALGLFTALRYYWVTRLGERIVADLRKSVYGHILTLDPAFFIATRTGEVLSRLTTDKCIVISRSFSSVRACLITNKCSVTCGCCCRRIETKEKISVCSGV
jgi:ATP-binding cassette subfamily B protein